MLQLQAVLGALLITSAGAAGADEISRGREIYGNYCQGCHGGEAAGLSGFTGDLAALRLRLLGAANMPDMSGVVTEAEATDLFAFIESRRPH